MMRRLLRRAVLLVSVLSILVIPTGTSSAQEDPTHDGEFEGTVLASNVVSPCPDPLQPATHCRDTGDFLDALIDLVARRPADGGPREELTCVATEGETVPFSARQDATQGRGFIGPAPAIEATGTLVRDGTEREDVVCRIVVADGVFHRVGTAAEGRLRVTIEARRLDTNDLVFSHHYCGRFAATAVPTPPLGTAVTAEADGRVDGCAEPDPTHNMNRVAADDSDIHG